MPTFGLVSTTKKGESIFDFPQGRPELRHRLSPVQEVYEFDQEAWDQIVSFGFVLLYLVSILNTPTPSIKIILLKTLVIRHDGGTGAAIPAYSC